MPKSPEQFNNGEMKKEEEIVDKQKKGKKFYIHHDFEIGKGGKATVRISKTPREGSFIEHMEDSTRQEIKKEIERNKKIAKEVESMSPEDLKLFEDYDQKNVPRVIGVSNDNPNTELLKHAKEAAKPLEERFGKHWGVYFDSWCFRYKGVDKYEAIDIQRTIQYHQSKEEISLLEKYYQKMKEALTKKEIKIAPDLFEELQDNIGPKWRWILQVYAKTFHPDDV